MLRTTETVVILSAAVCHPERSDREASPEGEDLGFDVTQNQRADPSALRSFGMTNK